MNGQIFTFYSYKGGVGRSMALANIAMYFFQRRALNVLMIDWDLEAPGLERYFESRYSLNLDETTEHLGLIDLIQHYKSNLSNPPSSPNASPYPNLSDYIQILDERDGSRLMILSAGRRGNSEAWKHYAQFVQTFDWADFYQNWAGGGFIDWLRQESRHSADLVLLDSRTGVTEMGGISTQQMADHVVMLFASNAENMENSSRMARSFMSDEVAEKRNQKLNVITVPSRIDDSDSRSYTEFLKRSRELFAAFQLPEFGKNAVHEMVLPYLPLFSHQEAVLFGNSELEDAGKRLVNGYNIVASNMIALVPDGHEIRTGRLQNEGDQRASVFISYPTDAYEIADEIRMGLKERGFEVQPSFHPSTWSTTSEVDDELQIEQSLCLIILINRQTGSSKLVRQFIELARNAQKPIIPLVISEEDFRMPLELRSLQYLNWFSPDNYPWERLSESLNYFIGQREHTSITTTPASIRNKRLYISYSPRDSRDVARRIAEYLLAYDFDLFIDYKSITPGSEWASVIEEELEKADIFIVLVSPQSVEKDSFVRREIAYASILEKVIIPILVHDARMPIQLINYQYIDFRHDITGGLAQLLRRLNQL